MKYSVITRYLAPSMSQQIVYGMQSTYKQLEYTS